MNVLWHIISSLQGSISRRSFISKKANFEIRLFYPVFSLLAWVLFSLLLYIYIIGGKSIWIYGYMDIWIYKDIKIENSMNIDKDKDKKIEIEIDREI